MKIVLCLKLYNIGLEIVPPFNSYFLGLHVRQFLTVLSNPLSLLTAIFVWTCLKVKV